MVEQAPVSDIDDDAKLTKKARSLLNRLVDMSNDYAHDRNRIRGLVLFEDRTDGRPRLMSKVEYADRPEIELLLQHRNECRRLASKVEGLHTFIAQLQAEIEHDKSTLLAVANSLKTIAQLEAQKMAHFNAIETLLATLTKTMVTQESIMAKLTADAAAMTQKMTEHKDKMELANKAAAIPTTLELKQRLALKYNVPVEQVDAILSAKTIEAEPSPE